MCEGDLLVFLAPSEREDGVWRVLITIEGTERVNLNTEQPHCELLLEDVVDGESRCQGRGINLARLSSACKVSAALQPAGATGRNSHNETVSAWATTSTNQERVRAEHLQILVSYNRECLQSVDAGALPRLSIHDGLHKAFSDETEVTTVLTE